LKDIRTYTGVVAAVIIMAAAVACSTEKNTAQSRWWHSFNAKYNTYYNGSMAYIDGSLEKEQGNADNFTEMIPLYTVGNKASREIGKANYDRAIEKSRKAIKRHSIKRRPQWKKSRKKTERDIEWLNRREYNPFLWKAWMLMGRAQFMKGAFDEAASTFAYMSRLYGTQPAIYGKARAWLAKCYIEQDWLYDAEDVIAKMSRDSIHWRAQKEWDYTLADYYIHTGRYEEAVTYLRKVIRHEMRRKQKAREWYLLGQLEAALGHREQAYKAFRHVTRLNPPYQLDFNARIAMTEVMAGGKPKQMISRLRRMAASDNNKDYLDQVYYAIGNIHLAQKDTAAAIAAYEKGNVKATRAGIEKGVLLLHLGDLYWQQEKFGDARRCYGEAIGLLDKERKDYKQLSERSKILDELVPYTEAVHLQDSLQALAAMPEKERNAAIDRVIEELKKKEKEERRAQAEAEAEKTLAQQGGMGNTQKTNTAQTAQTAKDGMWYFYNPLAVSQGKAAFQKQWGKRDNVDDWQRINKTVVAADGMDGELTDEQRDSIAVAEAVQDSLENIADSAHNDPHKREYYLAQIPFTEEQMAESNGIIMDGLHNSGVIFKDKLDNLHLSEKQLLRLTGRYPEYERMDDVLYHLFLLYSRKGDAATAASYLDKLKRQFPESGWTALLSDPHYAENARHGTHIEDSLYAATYDAFKADRFSEVRANTALSEERFPLGANRDKFIFIGGLGKLNAGDNAGCLEDMRKVVEKYPQSEVSPMAGMIINGVKAGRRLHGGKFDMGSVWERRTEVLNDSDSIAARKFTAERNTDFVCLIAYQPDSVSENQLLFELARYNFTNFLVRNFDMSIEELDGLHRMRIAGFRNYDEVLQYTRRMYDNGNIAGLLRKARVILISGSNLELLGTQFSYNDYDTFYEKHFLPLKISTVMLLTEPDGIEYDKEREPERTEEDGLYNGGVVDDGMLIDLGVDDRPEDSGTIEIPEETVTQPAPADDTIVLPEEKADAPADDTIVMPEEKAVAPADNAIVMPEETKDSPAERQENRTDAPAKADGIKTAPQADKPERQPAAAEPQPKKAEPAKAQTTRPAQQRQEDTGIDFNDDFGGTPAPRNDNGDKQKRQEINIEDEYYDLEGF